MHILTLLRGLLTVLSAQCSLGVTAHWLTGAQGLLQQQLGRALWLRLESNSKEVSGADSAEQATGASAAYAQRRQRQQQIT